MALRSCLCKTMEKMANDRLCEYLDMNKVLHNIQCGGRKNRETNYLVRLDSQIRKAFYKQEYFISVFYDVEKAHDPTRRYGILQDLHRMKLRGKLPRFITAFIEDRNI